MRESSVLQHPPQDFATAFYGKEPLNQSQSRPRRPRVQITNLNPNMDGETVRLRARVQTSRAQGNKMVFLVLRQRIDSVQALLTVAPEKVSKQMAKWTAGLQDESIVLVEGVVKKSPEIIKSATVGDVELHISQVSFVRDYYLLQTFTLVFLTDPSYFWLGRTSSLHRRGCHTTGNGDRNDRRRSVQACAPRHPSQQPYH